jgi:hypothetical protein
MTRTELTNLKTQLAKAVSDPVRVAMRRDVEELIEEVAQSWAEIERLKTVIGNVLDPVVDARNDDRE